MYLPIVSLRAKLVKYFWCCMYLFRTCLVRCSFSNSSYLFWRQFLSPIPSLSTFNSDFLKLKLLCNLTALGYVHWLSRPWKRKPASSSSGNISLSVARSLEITSLLLSQKRTLGNSPARSDTALKITLFFFPLVVPVKAINN